MELIKKKEFKNNYYYTVNQIEQTLQTNNYHYLCTVMLYQFTNKNLFNKKDLLDKLFNNLVVQGCFKSSKDLKSLKRIFHSEKMK